MPPVEHHIRVPRTARYFVLGQPGKGIRELWVACHGYGQLAHDFAKALEPLAADYRVVVAPEGLSRFYLGEPAKRHGPASPVGASWMTREDREHEIVDHVEYLDSLTSAIASEMGGPQLQVIALGFSQGVATAARWAALGRTRIRHLVMWAGTLPPDLPKDRGDQLFRSASVTIVAGLHDLLMTPALAEKARAELEAQGIRGRAIEFDGGHSLNSATLRLLAEEISSGA